MPKDEQPFHIALPVGQSDIFALATLAQSVEQRFRKAKVPSSNLGGGSRAAGR